jgi:hypothetical protein
MDDDGGGSSSDSENSYFIQEFTSFISSVYTGAK